MSDAPAFSYTRLYAEEGVSHFEDVVVPAGAEGAIPALAVDSMVPCNLVGTPPAPTSHNAPRRQFIVHLEGSVEVEASAGEIRRFGPGAVVLAEDLDGRGHVTTWAGEGPWSWLLLPTNG